eukprot:9479277-Pyramimonas_sp.AAC.1
MVGPTYFGAAGQATRPDYLVVPQGLVQSPQTCGIWWKAAAAVQQLKDSVPRDQEPLIARADIVMPNFVSGLLRSFWDCDNMAGSLPTGDYRNELISAIRDRAGEQHR